MKNKLFLIKSVILMLLSAFSIPSDAQSVATDVAQYTNIDLSGNWKANYEQSYFGDAPRYTAYKALKITQKAGFIELAKTDIADINTDTIINERIPLNGNFFQYVDSNRRTRKLSANWSEDGKTLNLNTTASLIDDASKEQFRSNERYSLDESGKVLIVKRTVKDNTGFEYYIKVIYDKQ